nr:reverse transcriptase domain-containing protein [Tanacetum cinerariifolium]
MELNLPLKKSICLTQAFRSHFLLKEDRKKLKVKKEGSDVYEQNEPQIEKADQWEIPLSIRVLRWERNAGQATATPQRGRTGGRTGRRGGRTRGRFGDQGNGGIDGQGGQVGGQGTEVNDGVDGVPEFSTFIAQQLHKLLPTILAQEFLACNLKDYDGKGGTMVYTYWIEKMESVQDMSGCRDNQKVKYTTGSFVGKALTCWNSQIHTRSREAAVSMSWEDFKTLTSEEFCPINELQKLETEFWNHAMIKSRDSVLGALKFLYICFKRVLCVFFVASLPLNLALVTGPGIVKVEVPSAFVVVRAIERLKQGESINVQDLETNLFWKFGKFTSLDGESLESYYSRFYKMMNELTRNQCNVTYHQVNGQFLLQSQPEWNRGKAIVKSPQPISDQEPSMVDDDDETSKDKEIDKLMALISLSFNKIDKPTNNNLRTSSNTSCANQDNSPRIHQNAGYESQRSGNVAGARLTVGSSMKPKRAKDAAYHREKMLLYKQEEIRIQLNADQADWKDDTDDESDNQELEAHYMYMDKIQEVSPDAVDSGPIF